MKSICCSVHHEDCIYIHRVNFTASLLFLSWPYFPTPLVHMTTVIYNYSISSLFNQYLNLSFITPIYCKNKHCSCAPVCNCMGFQIRKHVSSSGDVSHFHQGFCGNFQTLYWAVVNSMMVHSVALWNWPLLRKFCGSTCSTEHNWYSTHYTYYKTCCPQKEEFVSWTGTWYSVSKTGDIQKAQNASISGNIMNVS